MTSLTHTHVELNPAAKLATPPRFGGLLWRLSRRMNGLARPLAGRRWNPIFALVVHRGRRSGHAYLTPVAARRVADGFIISLAFGAQVDWYRNLVAASGGAIRWRSRDYHVAAPVTIGVEEALAAFLPVQRLFLRIGRVDGYIRVRDAEVPSR